MERNRCPWVDLTKPDYIAYHDEEWGVPVHDDLKMFELLTLESAQAGLSWYTVLKKRENYREAFDGFNPEKIARYDAKKLESLLQNPGIIRNRSKIEAAIQNAKCYLKLQNFSDFLWQFVDGKTIVNALKTKADFIATSPESDAMSKTLKKLGFAFVGSTICYAHMQATGMVNDHTVDCFRYHQV